MARQARTSNHSVIQELAAYMPQALPDSEATVHFEGLSGALIWSDELPKPTPPFELIGDLRAILHFRTSLILGKPNEKYRTKWEEAKRLFPGWPGFDPKRSDPSLKGVHDSLQRRFYRSCRETEAKFDEDQHAGDHSH